MQNAVEPQMSGAAGIDADVARDPDRKPNGVGGADSGEALFGLGFQRFQAERGSSCTHRHPCQNRTVTISLNFYALRLFL